MIVGPIDALCLLEKLGPPRALKQLGGALYAPPLGTSKTAYIAWMPAAEDAFLDPSIERARSDGAHTLRLGGPPGNYVASGLPSSEAACRAFFERRGFAERGRHAELLVRTDGQVAHPSAERVANSAEVVEWVSERFGGTWAMEAERASTHGGLFASRDDGGALVGFAAHSGNRAWTATFGPIGVLAEARGRSTGRRLTETVLADLADRGHATATIPWVDAATVRFYDRFCEVLRRDEVIELALDLRVPEPRSTR